MKNTVHHYFFSSRLHHSFWMLLRQNVQQQVPEKSICTPWKCQNTQNWKMWLQTISGPELLQKNEVNHQPRNLVIYGSNSVLVPIRSKRQRFLISQLSCLVFIFRPTFEIEKLGIITVAFPIDIAEKVSLGERQKGQKLQISLGSKYTKAIRDLLSA